MRKLVVILLACSLAAPAVADSVKLKTADKMNLVAEWIPPTGKKYGVIVALHMFQAHRFTWKRMWTKAGDFGMGVLALDLRGHGESRFQGKGKAKRDFRIRAGAKDETLFNAMHHDVAAAMAFLQKKGYGPEKVILVGASVGCSVALHYASLNPKVAGAVLLTPGKHYLGVPSMGHIKKWGNRPLMLVSAKEEVKKGARALFDALENKRPAVLLQLPQTDIHGTQMFGKVDGIERRIIEWSAIQLGHIVGP